MGIILDDNQFRKFADEMANKFPVFAIQSAVPAMGDATAFLLSAVPEYPPETLDPLLPPDGVSFLKTDQQRKWFWASVKSGNLKGWQWVDGQAVKIGGARTGNLGRSQTSEVVSDENSVVGYVGFDSAIAPYAPWVVGEDYPGQEINGISMYQARVHVDRWWQFGIIISDNVEEAWSIFNETFWEEFSRRVNNEK